MDKEVLELLQSMAESIKNLTIEVKELKAGQEELKAEQKETNKRLDNLEKGQKEISLRIDDISKGIGKLVSDEIGESISIIKKKGIAAIMNDAEIRKNFITEMTDVARYYVEVINRLKITPEEYAQCYIKKHKECINRNYEEKWKKD